MRAPRGQGFILLLFMAGALLGLLTLGLGIDRWGTGIGWALMVTAGLLVGASVYHWLRSAGHPQEP